MRTLATAAFAACVAPVSATALDLQECTRTTYISHGGETGHRDLGEGRVLWINWWSQEGTATDVVVADCFDGRSLMFRTAESHMNSRLPFDRTDKALKVIETHESGDRAFATFDRMGADLKGIARDVGIRTLIEEVCACAALYPEARGDKTEFKLGG